MALSTAEGWQEAAKSSQKGLEEMENSSATHLSVLRDDRKEEQWPAKAAQSGFRAPLPQAVGPVTALSLCVSAPGAAYTKGPVGQATLRIVVNNACVVHESLRWA